MTQHLECQTFYFDEFYPDIDQARKIYFNRLVDKPDFQIFFDMYKWFNTALGTIIEQVIPRKTKFLGINFVIESHVLERNKFRYLFDEIYLKALDRDTDRGNIFLSQVVGNVREILMTIKPFRDRPHNDIDATRSITAITGGMDTTLVDRFRQGVSVRDQNDFSQMLIPYISSVGFPSRKCNTICTRS